MSLERKGWISKKSGKKGSNSWKTRWMVTENNTLVYYKKEDQKQKCGVIDLTTAVEVRSHDHKKKPNVLEIVCPDRSWVLSCSKGYERDGWVQTVSKIMATSQSGGNGSGRVMHRTTSSTISREGTSMADVTGMSRSISVTKMKHRHYSITSSSDFQESISEMEELSQLESLSIAPTTDSALTTPRLSGKEAPVVVAATATATATTSTAASPDQIHSARTPSPTPSGTLVESTHSKVDRDKDDARLKDRVKKVKGNLERAAIKRGAYMAGVPIGKLFVTVLCAQFDEQMDPSVKPMIEAYFERQVIESSVSKNPSNPHWKDNFLFEVSSLESRLKLKIFDKVKSDTTQLSYVNILIKHLEDQKQYRQWYDFSGSFNGKLKLSWRFESNAPRKDEDLISDLSDVSGHVSLTVIGAHSLLERPTGAPPNPRAVITYGKSEYITDTISNTNSPEWNYSCLLRIRKEDEFNCTIRLEDMDKVQHTHLGSITLTRQMLETDSEDVIQSEMTLQLDEATDDPNDNMVGGELKIQYRYKPVHHVYKLVAEEQASHQNEAPIEVDFNDVPEGFPEPPPQVPKDFLGTTKEEHAEWMKLKFLRQSWENALVTYRKKEHLGDEQGMYAAIETYKKERKAAVPEARGIRRGGEVQLGTRKNLTSSNSKLILSPAGTPRSNPSFLGPKSVSPAVTPSSDNPFDDDPSPPGSNNSPSTSSPRIIPIGTVNNITSPPGSRNSQPKSTVTAPPPSPSLKSPRNPARFSIPVGPHGGNPFESSLNDNPFNAPTPPADDGNPFDQKEEDWFAISNSYTNDTAVPDLVYKIIIIGSSGVGKTNLLYRWLDNTFSQRTATINVEFAVKTFNVNGTIVKVQIWDTAGQEQYRSVTRSFYRNAKGAIIVYDITKRDSFNSLSSWLMDIREAQGNAATEILLIGNKVDLELERNVTTEQGLKFAKDNAINFMETSAKSGSNVDRAFQILLSDIHKQEYKNVGSTSSTTSPSKTQSAGIVLEPTNDSSLQETSCCDTSSIDSSLDSFKSFASSWFS